MIDFCTSRLSPVSVLLLNHSRSVILFTFMARDEKKLAIHEKLARCIQLAKEFISDQRQTPSRIRGRRYWLSFAD